jgi:predicted cupin superfamily sugar epimerase
VRRSAAEVVEDLGLRPIPREGAWYAPGPRTRGLSSITVLLERSPDGFSAVHRLAVDEGWQWLAGDPAALLRLRPTGPPGGRRSAASGRHPRTGSLTLLDAGAPQRLVHRGTWQGAATLGDWTLLACWCAPAFRDEHFTLGEREALVTAYPDFADEVTLLTREDA